MRIILLALFASIHLSYSSDFLKTIELHYKAHRKKVVQNRMIEAARSGNKEEFLGALLSGAHVHSPNEYGEYAHITAAWTGNSEVIEWYQENEPEFLTKTDYLDNTCLTAATNHYRNNVLHYLIGKVPIDQRGGLGLTALQWSCRIGNKEGMELLLQNNANTETALPHTERPLTCACRTRNQALIPALLKHNARVEKSDLVLAIDHGLDEPYIDLLLNKETASVEALKAAVRQNSPLLVEKLLQYVSFLENDKLYPSPFYLVQDNGIKKWLTIKALIYSGDLGNP